jgi:hypothetical protein
MQQSRLNTWLSFGSAQPSKVAQFSVGANTQDLLDGSEGLPVGGLPLGYQSIVTFASLTSLANFSVSPLIWAAI